MIDKTLLALAESAFPGFDVTQLDELAKELIADIMAIPDQWREDTVRIVMFAEALFVKIDSLVADVIRALDTGDKEAAFAALVQLKALGTAAPKLVGEYVDRGLDVTRAPWKHIGGDPFKGERKLAKQFASDFDLDPILQERIGARAKTT